MYPSIAIVDRPNFRFEHDPDDKSKYIQSDTLEVASRINRNNLYNISYSPFQTYLGDLDSPDLHLFSPLGLNIDQEIDGTFVISDDIFLVYGEGDSRASAISDYVVSLKEFYYILKEGSKNNLFDKKQFEILNKYIKSL